ncbi:aldo/keto reductase [Pectobacterium jejuense]|uniref:aldo/keto reductase family protein n=1 Tax=Pectobacterium jejuense TaxID=2974022 RepID=UPI0032ED6122
MYKCDIHINLNDDVKIPTIGFGTFQLEGSDAGEAVFNAIELGYRHIDTASVYQNEEAVGAGIKKGLARTGAQRHELFVTTKLWPGYSAWGETVKSYSETMAAFNESLDKLELDYIDLYLIHSPHGGTERLSQWRALLELKNSGKVRSIGVSNYSIKHIEEIKNAGLPLPEVNQIELHPWSQKTELVSYLRNNNITPIAYSSLAPLSTWRNKPGETSAKTSEMSIDDGVFFNLAKKYHVTEAQFLLRWAIQQGYAVLPKSLNPIRMRQNLDLFGFNIVKNDMDLIQTMDRGHGIAWSIGDPSLID